MENPNNSIRTYFSATFTILCLMVAGTVLAQDLPASAQETSPLKTGDAAPAFNVHNVDDEVFSFEPASLERPVVLISFRGGWCPFCNMHLSELRTVIPEIRAMGFDVYFISNDRPELLYESLKLETQEDIAGLDYIILSDADLEAARAFGTAFEVNQARLDYLNNNHKDYAGSSVDKDNALAVPSVYVIDTSGMIVFDFVNANYKVRIPADELLRVAKDNAP